MVQISSCYKAEYMNAMVQAENDELLASQILSSSNCQYILIRTPPSILSFYSVSDAAIINTWSMNNNNNNDSIWSIHTSSYPQQITISDTGCLHWSTTGDLVLENICSNTDEYSSNQLLHSKHSSSKQVSVSSNTGPNQSINHNTTDLFSNQIVWIPILGCIVGVIFIILCYILSKKFCDKKDLNKIDLNDERESNSNGPGTNNTKIHADSDNDNHTFCAVDDLQVNLDNIGDMDTDDENSSDDDYIDIENGIDNGIENGIENAFTFDLRAHHLVSQDITVSNHILTPSNDNTSAYHHQNVMI